MFPKVVMSMGNEMRIRAHDGDSGVRVSARACLRENRGTRDMRVLGLRGHWMGGSEADGEGNAVF